MNSTNLNFDTLYSQICDNLRESNLTEQVLNSLKAASSDLDRVQIILQQNPDIIELFSTNIVDTFIPKNEIKSQEIFKAACKNNSIELINQALCLCPYTNDIKLLLSPRDIRNPITLKKFFEHEPSSAIPKNEEIISNIFNERSKMLYDKGYFEFSILDIIRSVDFGYDKTFEMISRMGKIYKHLGLFNEAKSVIQQALQLLRISPMDNEYKSKETINLVNILKDIKQLETFENNPSTIKKDMKKEQLILDNLDVYGGLNPILCRSSNAIELKFNEERGRHVVATRTIPPGSTLIIENPYSWSVSTEECLFHCSFCMQSTLNGIPCPGCFSVMFCSETCFKNATEVLSPQECKVKGLLDSSEKLGRMSLLCFRTIMQTPLAVIKQEFQKLSKTPKPTLEMIMGFDKDGKLDSSNYSSVFAQTTNSHGRNGGDLLKRTYAALYLTLCLRYIGYFGNETEPIKDRLSEDEKMISAVLLRHLQSASCNAYGVNHVSEVDRSQPLGISEIGGATYPIISTTNHSCSPNAYRFNIGKTCVVKSIREIPEGEEVLDSYGHLHTISPLAERLQELENQYLFKCTCEACLNDWPTFAELRNPGHVNVYKCPNCHIGKLESITSNGKRKCMGCGKMTDFKKVQKLLKTAEDKYLRAKEAVLQQRNHNLDIEKWICSYILTVQKVLFTPCKEIVEAQEILKLHWNLWVTYGHFPRF